jgi:hypothetical protein
MDIDFRKFKHVDLGEMRERYINFFKAEYVTSKIFLKNGHIKKYLNHSLIKQLPSEEFEFLLQQSFCPWKFSFAEIIKNPSDCFYEMKDVYTHETYLLYSPSMKLTLSEYNPQLWFNLIGFNGKCWQTFGIVSHFRSFDEDDIFFFATELNPEIQDEEELVNEIERNPVPFFMLISASEKPSIANKGHLILHNYAIDSLNQFALDPYKEKFNVAWNENVFQLKLKTGSEFPHYAIAYFDEKQNTISRTALTDVGFQKLTQALNKCGLKLDEDADIRVSLTMFATAKEILKKDIELYPYESLFSHSDLEEEEDEETALDNYNEFIKLALPYLNDRKKPNLIALSKKAEIEYEMEKKILAILKRTRD